MARFYDKTEKARKENESNVTSGDCETLISFEHNEKPVIIELCKSVSVETFDTCKWMSGRSVRVGIKFSDSRKKTLYFVKWQVKGNISWNICYISDRSKSATTRFNNCCKNVKYLEFVQK